MKTIKILYAVIINLLRTRLSRVQFIMVIATLAGFTSGLVAVLLKSLVHIIQNSIENIPVNLQQEIINMQNG